MVKRLLVVAVAMVLGEGAAIAHAAPKPTEPTFLEEAQRAARETLKDGESARFKDLRVTEGKKLDMTFKALCGQVNAKNSYGGYGGFARFVTYRVANYDFKTVIEGEDSATPFMSSWAEYCGNAGTR